MKFLDSEGLTYYSQILKNFFVKKTDTATSLTAGVVKLATNTETVAGTDTTEAVTPAGVQAAINASKPASATTSLPGLVELATNAETQTGTDASRAVTPAGAKATYLPLSGGTLTGSINISGHIVATPNQNSIDIGHKYSDGSGAMIALRGKNYSEPGEFVIFAKTPEAVKIFNGRPNGDLFWDAKRVPTTGNNTGTVGSSTAPVYVDGGTIKACSLSNAYLPLSGGTIKGDLILNEGELKIRKTYSDGSGNTWCTSVIRATTSNSTYGNNVSFGAFGSTIVGSGESITEQMNNLSDIIGDEQLYLVSDSAVHIKSNCSTFANAKEMVFDTAGNLTIPGSIKTSGEFARATKDSSFICIRGYSDAHTTGPHIWIYGKEHATFPGLIQIKGESATSNTHINVAHDLISFSSSNEEHKNLTWNPTTGVLTTTSFSGSLTGTASNASKLNNMATFNYTSPFWPFIASVSSGGVLEVGKHIDFHEAQDNTDDFTVRLTATAEKLNCSKPFQATSYIGLPNATDAAKGVVELATSAEVTTGTDTTRAVTPAGVRAACAPLPKTASGVGQVWSYMGTAACSLPAGGTWEYWGFFQMTNTKTINSAVHGIAPGGELISPGNELILRVFWAQRIA